MGYKVAILGATGVVGRKLAEVLEERKFPIDELVPLASERSLGEGIEFGGKDIAVRVAAPEAFKGVDIVLSSAGGSVSQKLLPEAAKHGAVSIDNTSAFRMEADVPLVVPEVNAHRIPEYGKRRIIANPNCSTIQMVVALKPLHDAAVIKRIVVSTYQSCSGAGKTALDDLFEETRSVYTQDDYTRQKFKRRIAFNVIPQIDVFMDDGATKEEWKMRVETKKIMEADIAVAATCVRVPVFFGHSESVWIETEKALSPAAARDLLAKAPGVTLMDDTAKEQYPTPQETADNDDVYVGRLRADGSVKNGLSMWIVSDNIRKGAATNAVQIAEHLVKHWEEHGRS